MEGGLVKRQKRRRSQFEVLDRKAQRRGAEKLTIAVLMGGPGSERQVSLASGAAVAEALAGQGHRVLRAELGAEDLTSLDQDGAEVMFVALHGQFGEGGQLQQILKSRGMRYTGSGPRSSRLAMDKHRAKKVFTQAGLLAPNGVLIAAPPSVQALRSGGRPAGKLHSATQRKITQAISQIGLPCVVKPNIEGSSVGVVIAQTAEQAEAAAAENLFRHGDCLIEQYIRGRELTVGILAGQALPVIEVRTRRQFYDYQAKYDDDDTEYIVEGDLDLGLGQLRGIQKQALRAFGALGCRDFARVDLILDELGRPFFLEVNTIPGFTSHSLLPKAAAAAGVTMGQMCEQIAQIAWQRPI